MILLIDNYDSFTWNLYDYLAQQGKEVVVKRNDAITINDIAALQPEAIVISPGPETPVEAGITMTLINEFKNTFPILGICLGYQALGIHFGATLIKSPILVHGKTSQINIREDDIFKQIPAKIEVMRYHSLNITNIPQCLTIIASTSTNEPMALKHNSLPLYGFQFHPESILTQFGLHMIKNWIATWQR